MPRDHERSKKIPSAGMVPCGSRAYHGSDPGDVGRACGGEGERRISRGCPRRTRGVAGIVPHAGWEFSGSLALEVMSYLSRSIDTIVIIGGHLGPSDGILCAMEDGYETPLGPMAADRELLGALGRAARLREDRSADNSVEVQLPFARYLFPHARVLCLRAAPSEDASALGKAIAAACRQLGRKAAVVGSTDLTHYGPAYGFSPAGSGEKALSWMRDVNDRRFIEALLQMDDTSALGLARTRKIGMLRWWSTVRHQLRTGNGRACGEAPAVCHQLRSPFR